MPFQEFGSINCEYCVLSSPVCPRRQKARHSLRREPEKHFAIQEAIPFGGCHSLEAFSKGAFAHRFLVSDDCRTIFIMWDRDRFRTTTTFNYPSLLAVDPIHVQ